MIMRRIIAVTNRNHHMGAWTKRLVQQQKPVMSASFSTTASPSSFETVGIVGLGLMGHGICQVAASSPNVKKVIAFELEEEFLQRGKQRIETSLSKLVSKGKMTSEIKDEILQQRILFTTDMNDLKSSDFVCEAIREDLQLKQNLFASLNDICPPETILASNTSSLPITEMSLARPKQFVGVHFFNPVQLMPLVEVISTDQTDPSVTERVVHWISNDLQNKVPVTCGDTPGFIVNRLLIPALLQAMAMVDRGDASIANIDVAMKLGCGYPMGPLHLADYIGLDTCLYIVEGWVAKYPDEACFFVPKTLAEKVAAGHLGRKTGRGFYIWEGDQRGEPVE